LPFSIKNQTFSRRSFVAFVGIFTNIYYVMEEHSQRYTFFHNKAGSAGQKKAAENRIELNH
jgi:hypothetical protein